MYADDTVLLFASKCSAQLEEISRQCLNNVFLYSMNNRLKLNIGKSKFMLFKHSRNLFLDIHLELNNEIFEQVANYKYLGFKLDSGLKFDDFINHLCSKLKICAGVLSKCSYFLTKSQLNIIFNCIGLTFINYFGVVCFGISKNSLRSLANDYNHCGSCIFNCYINCLYKFNWPSLETIILKLQLCFLHNQFCPTLKAVLFHQLRQHSHKLRHSSKLNVQRFNSNIGQRSILHCGAL